ncbi:hypothetical protein BRARA_C04203 [Brassica rapa]|uniref:Uncharacterized protein n=2 Tax=Brassica TaxID=3705 RepID=A0ABQ8DZQ0_BRANA|nr:uncharacterized protein LOC106374999 [Brassica napus]KAH0934829.1 hypothetical protein HID58_011946 [Brassica napus]RID72303.1 hypothetical protein BRARA_C04203 [Brassica rapa]CAG7883364.1 unnamed protein product [Brassica rapa]VDC82560.1 unnamed protein product [Brassica rapa]
MTNESATSTAIPPQHSEQHQPPPIPINSPPAATMSVAANSNGVAFDETVEEPPCFKYLDSKEYADKYKKYESEFKQWILAKHFYPNAVNLYEGRTTIGGETILSSKWPCTRFYADPCVSFAQQESVEIGLVPNGAIVSEKKSC